MLQKLDVSNKECQALILAPSPERARQIREIILELGTFMNVECFSCGSKAKGDRDALRKEGSQIITGKPGRVLGTITLAKLKMDSLKMIVMDQLDEGFPEDAWGSLPSLFQLMPQKPQVVIVSPTIPRQEATSKIMQGHVHIEVREATSEIIHHPVYIAAKKEATSKSGLDHNVNKDGLQPKSVKQFYVVVKSKEFKLDAVCNLCDMIPATHVVIFYDNHEKFGELKEKLTSRNFAASAIHCDMLQDQRDEVMNAFRSGSFRILISTDQLLQDADVQNVSLVLNYDLPANMETYRLRVGGHKGATINLMTKEDMPKLKGIEEFCSVKISEILLKGPAYLDPE